MTPAELIEALPATHRRTVAASLGLRRNAKAASIAAALLDPAVLAQPLATVSSEARSLAVTVALGHGGFHSHTHGEDHPVAIELERIGLLFAVKERWSTAYHMPDELRPPVARALAEPHARRARQGRAKRYLAAPLQIAHDAAALHAILGRSPVRVKVDGGIYSRDWSKLAAALPPLDGLEASATLEGERLPLALSFLQDSRHLRLRVDDRPGRWEERRELIATGDLGATLAAPDGELRGRLADLTEGEAGVAGARALAGAIADRTVSLASFGAALRGMVEEGDYGVRGASGDGELALYGLAPLWLAGEIELGVDAAGRPSAVRPSSAEAPAADSPVAVCQSNFELVLLRPPSAAERAVLELCCERRAGQAHVLRLTRDSVRSAAASPGGRHGVATMLADLAGELPQNVARSIEDWSQGVEPPLRLRSALFLEAHSAEAAERLASGPLAGLLAERLGERLLAVPGNRLDRVEGALAAAGLELEPGLDRVSGSWRERPSRSGPAESAWAPRPAASEEQERGWDGLVSTIGTDEPPAGRRSNGDRGPKGDGHEPAPGEGGPGEPLDVLLEALEEECEVAIVYAGARGVTHRTITPLEIDDSRLRAWCHLRDDERSFWLRSVLAAEAVA